MLLQLFVHGLEQLFIPPFFGKLSPETTKRNAVIYPIFDLVVAQTIPGLQKCHLKKNDSFTGKAAYGAFAFLIM
jgi:hypothetical protein